MQFEVAIGESAAQIELHIAALLRLTIHLALEEAMHTAAFGLGPVQCHVGIAHQLFAGIAIAR
jgi:hypothetical protein